MADTGKAATRVGTFSIVAEVALLAFIHIWQEGETAGMAVGSAGGTTAHLQVQPLSKAPCIPCSPATLPEWPRLLTHARIIQPQEPFGAAHRIPSNWPRSPCGETASENERPRRPLS